MPEVAQFAKQLPNFVLEFIIGVRSSNVGKIFFHSAHVGVNAHAVIIKDNEQVGIFGSCVIQPFKCESGSNSSIANHGNYLFILLVVSVGNCHSKSCRYGSGRMPYSKRIVLAFTSLRKPADPFVNSIGMKKFSSAGKNFMPIRLVTYI